MSVSNGMDQECTCASSVVDLPSAVNVNNSHNQTPVEATEDKSLVQSRQVSIELNCDNIENVTEQTVKL